MTREEQKAVEEFTEMNLTKKGLYHYTDMQDAFLIGLFKGEKMQPSLPSNLDEAAERAYPIDISGYSVECRVGAIPEPLDYHERERKAFKAGAEWMAGQGWHEEAVIKGSYDVVWLNYNVELPIDLAKYFKPGDKVVVQIRKK